jgi:uncharacterized protein (DUF983 family)
MPSAPPGTKLWRGVRKRCARCGASGIFESHFRLRERCPQCGYRFERESGFWMGVYLVNYAVAAVVLVALILGAMFWAGDGSYPVVPVLVASLVVSVVMPLVLYPNAKSTWAAIDLTLRPLEPVEEAEAALHAAPGSG